MLLHYTYATTTEGSHLVVLGNVHGDETCGNIALTRLRGEIENGSIVLTRGRLTCVPCANPGAAAKGIRYIDRNLNRFLVPTEKPTTYEAKLGNILCPIIKDADVLLDLHSYVGAVGSPPFVFAGTKDRPRERAFAAVLGPQTLLHGWSAAYAASGRTSPSAAPKDLNESVGTTEWARQNGAWAAATIECGGHKDPNAVEVAYQAVQNALAHLGMIERTLPAMTTPHLVRVTKVIYREDDGSFAHPWKNLDPIKAGDILAMRASGEVLRAPEDGFLLLPHLDCEINQEWFYLGVQDTEGL